MTDQKLNLNINLGEIRYLEVPEIIDYKMFMTQKFKTTNPIDWIKFISAHKFSRSRIVKL